VAPDRVEEAADRLYALPFADFIRERGAAARELRRAGQKEAAAKVAKLPKPSQVAWAANQLARGGAGELLEAGEALREAQLGGGGREAVRAAAAAERSAVDELVRAAPPELSRQARDRLRALLHAVAGDEALRALFVGGRLVEEPAGGGGWPLGDVVAPASTPASKEGPEEGGEVRAARPKQRDAEARRKREQRDREAAERREREAAERREEAERRKLERRLKAARAAAEDARTRLEAAREAYESATHEVARIEEQHS